MKLIQLVRCLLLLSLAPKTLGETNDFQFVTAHDTQIVNEAGKPVFLQGISFGNRVWEYDRIPTKHHLAEDYKRVRDMGMNLVRFYLNYQTLESDHYPYRYLDDGWAWIDKNIEWARDNGVYLLLVMHTPQGDFQSNGDAWDLWRRDRLQKRLVAMWAAIAERYSEELVVLGYDLVSEPGVPDNVQQWQRVAQRLVNEIRQVDKKHPIFVERVNSIHGKWERGKDLNFVKIRDANIVYAFHTFEPYLYTHQMIFWDWLMCDRDGGGWPDEKANHTKAHLAGVIDGYLAWGKRNNVPMVLAGWGLYKATYDNQKGGLNYVRDMLDVLAARKLTNTFHVYHQESFGLYRGDDELNEKNVNYPLKALFTERLRGYSDAAH